MEICSCPTAGPGGGVKYANGVRSRLPESARKRTVMNKDMVLWDVGYDVTRKETEEG